MRTRTQLRAEHAGHFIHTRSVRPGEGMYIIGRANRAACTIETTERESHFSQCRATLPNDGGLISSLNRARLPCGSERRRGLSVGWERGAGPRDVQS